MDYTFYLPRAGKKFKQAADLYIDFYKIKDFSDLTIQQQRELASAFFEDQNHKVQEDILMCAHDYKVMGNIIAKGIKNPSCLNDFTTFFIDNIFKYMEGELHVEYSELVAKQERDVYEEIQQLKIVGTTTKSYIESNYV